MGVMEQVNSRGTSLVGFSLKLFSMKTTLSISSCVLLLSMLMAANAVSASPADFSDPAFKISSHDASREALQTPSIYFATPPDNYPCNEIGVYISNPNDQLSRVELYRSRNADTGFELIATLNEGESYYSDQDLVSLKTYYYKARIIREGEVSDFSAVASTQSPYMMHDPIVSAVLTPENTVEVSVQDRSYLDASYELYGWNITDQVQTFSTSIQMLDSGGTYTFIDTSVEPGKTYSYHVNAFLQCEGQPYVGEWSSNPVTIPLSLPSINSFTLVDSRTNQSVPLHDDDQFAASPKFSIIANTDVTTSSVEFILNGETYIENDEPYALFDGKGKTDGGNLKPGDYTLSATAYSSDNLEGVEGNTITIHFTVIRGNKDADASNEETVLNLFPNPVTTNLSIQVSGKPGATFDVQIIDQYGGRVMSSSATINAEGSGKQEWNASGMRKGTYYLIANLNEKTFTRRIFIK
jgi:hypothetical protein